MWTIDPSETFILRGSGGTLFTRFVDSLIRAEQRIPSDRLRTNLRTNLPDGGLDTHVMVGADEHPWLAVPTCWQHKGTDSRGLTEALIREEVNKPAVVELLKKGCGYRFAICDEITPDRVASLEATLSAEIRRINSSAPPPRVVTSSNLAAWGSEFPGIGIEFFNRRSKNLLSLRAWSQNFTDPTPKYVRVSDWEPTLQAVSRMLKNS